MSKLQTFLSYNSAFSFLPSFLTFQLLINSLIAVSLCSYLALKLHSELTNDLLVAISQILFLTLDLLTFLKLLKM